MKTILNLFAVVIISAAAVLSTFTAFAASTNTVDVTLSWEPSPDPVSSYKLWHVVGATNTAWTVVTNLPGITLSHTTTDVGVGFHRWRLTAVNDLGFESDPSNEVSFNVWKPRPATMKGVRLLIAKVAPTPNEANYATLEQSVDSKNWQAVGLWSLDKGVRQDFYRVLLQ